MSRAMVCDQCDTVLVLNSKGEADSGEDAGWVSVGLGDQSAEFCTRACAVAFLSDDDVSAAHDAYFEVITEIAHEIKSGREEAAGDAD